MCHPANWSNFLSSQQKEQNKVWMFTKETENCTKELFKTHIIRLNCKITVKQLRLYTAMCLINNPIIPLKINYVHIHRLQIVHYLDITLLYKHSVVHINNMQRIAEKLTNSGTPSVSSQTLHYLLSITWICGCAWCVFLLSAGIRWLAGIASGHAGMIWVAQ